MTRHRSARRLICGAAVSVLLIGWGATFAPFGAAAETPDLDQIIAPDQQQADGRVEVSEGHLDFGPSLATGELLLRIHDDSVTPAVWRKPADTVIRVTDAAQLAVPDDAAYSFLQLPPGTAVYVVPQTQQPQITWLGWNTQEPQFMSEVNGGVTLSLTRVEGPGDLVVYMQSGTFGDPQVLWSAHEPLPQAAWVEVNTHTHANWVFSAPGVYLVEMSFEAQTLAGERMLATDTLRFAVGNATASEDAFTASLAPSIDEGEKPVAPADPVTPDGFPSFAIIIIGALVLMAGAFVMFITLGSRAAKRAARIQELEATE